MLKEAKITIVGSGYVGMSLSVLLAQKNIVNVLDIDLKRVEKINNGISTVVDKEIDYFFKTKNLKITASNSKEKSLKESDFIIVATPTNYDEKTGHFDTSSVESVVSDAISLNPNALIVIKSTIPIGFTNSLQNKFKSNKIIFSPEFLREGNALKDNLYPSRIIIGGQSDKAKLFGAILKDASLMDDVNVLYTSSSEAEAIKLFSNTYLAMRVAFFNELDSYALSKELDTKSIIDGVCLDSRIGEGYNNPSFGYGGYCLPKDTKQLFCEYQDVPQNLIGSIIDSNSTRKDYLSNKILERSPNTVGFYKLAMKKGSDNYRSSSIQGIITRLKGKNIKLLIFDDSIDEGFFDGITVNQDIEEFKKICDVIVCNRIEDDLKDTVSKLFSRDLYGEN